MDPYLTYDLFRSRMDNESTRRLITESKDIGIVVDSKDAKQHLIFLIRLLDEWNSVQESVKSFTIVVPDKNAVIAITSDVEDLQGELNLVWEKILPAI